MPDSPGPRSTTGADSKYHKQLLVGVAYFIVGIVFGELAKRAGSEQTRFAWRLTAWVLSGAVYAGHIGYEHFKLRNTPRVVALHVGSAAAFGAFLLAVAAMVHAMTVSSHAPYWLFVIALFAWPLSTGLPASLVALLVSGVLAHVRAGSSLR